MTGTTTTTWAIVLSVLMLAACTSGLSGVVDAGSSPSVRHDLAVSHLRLGQEHLTQPAPIAALADHEFAAAVQLGGFPMAWRARDLHAIGGTGAGVRLWGTTAIDAEFPLPSVPGIDVDPQLFGPFPFDADDVLAFDTSVLVVSADRRAATAALNAARERLAMVDESGHEFADTSHVDIALSAGLPGLTPEWVSEVEQYDEGPGLVFDTEDGWMTGAQSHAMIHVVIGELVTAGVTEAVLRPAPDRAEG